jgi:hypothetical protein
MAWGCFSHISPRITLRWTSSIRAWHWVQVRATLARAMLERGSVCGSTLWAVWQEVHTAVTIRPFL